MIGVSSSAFSFDEENCFRTAAYLVAIAVAAPMRFADQAQIATLGMDKFLKTAAVKVLTFGELLFVENKTKKS